MWLRGRRRWLGYLIALAAVVLAGPSGASTPVRRRNYFRAPNSGEETHGVTMSTPFTTDEVMVVRRAILTGFYGEIDKKKNDRLRRSSSRIASKLHEEEDEVEEKQAEAGENRQERVRTGTGITRSARGRRSGPGERSPKAPDDDESDHRSDPEVDPIPAETPPGVSTRMLIGWPLPGRGRNRHGSALFHAVSAHKSTCWLELETRRAVDEILYPFSSAATI